MFSLTEVLQIFGQAADVSSVQIFTSDTFIQRKINQFEFNTPVVVYSISELTPVKEKLMDILSPSAKLLAVIGGHAEEKAVIELQQGVEAVYVKAAPFTERDRYSFGDLLEIIRRLRDPDGCPWDRAQTHASIRQNAIEEAYELVEAIDLRDNGKMLEESGDVLLQALFHSTIAEDNGEFNTTDMVSAICKKLVTRHTHIFGDNRADNAEEALGFWEKAKAKEKSQKGVMDKLQSVPVTFSALIRADKIQKIIKKTGFDFNCVEDAVKKLYEEIDELMSASDEKREGEGGDVLFAAVNVLRMLKIDSETALNATVTKFMRRFEYVVKKAEEGGRKPEQCTLDEMDGWYNEYKSLYEHR